MINARIYQSAKNAMQSGRAKTKGWILEYVPNAPKKPEPLMGWIEAGDTLGQIRVKFDTREGAEEFAKTQGLYYMIQDPHARSLKPRSYMDNFKYIPPEDE